MKFAHFSDIHFAKSGYDSLKLRNALLAKLSDMSPNLDFILITGDTFFKNDSRGDIIPSTTKFIQDITKACKTDKHRVYICMGNHDLDRGDAVRNDLVEKARNGQELTRDACKSLSEMGNVNYRSLYRTLKNKEYKDFEIIEPSNKDYRVVSINSCLLSKDDHDYQKLRVCSPQLEELGKKIKGDDKLNIAFMHHGVDWLEPSDAKKFEHWLEDNNIDVLFVGHTHQPNVVMMNDVQRDIFQFTSGALMIDGYAVPSFYLCEESKGTLSATLYSFSNKTESWEIDNHSLRKFKDDGRRYFCIPRLYKDLEEESERQDKVVQWNEIVDVLNKKYESRFGSRKFVSDKTGEREDFDAWKIVSSLVRINMPYQTAARLAEIAVDEIVALPASGPDMIHSSEIKETIYECILHSHKKISNLNEYDIAVWASNYARSYDKRVGFRVVDGDRTEEISYNLLKNDILKEVIVSITGNEIYYEKISMSEKESMAVAVMSFIKSLGITKIKRKALLDIITEYVTEPPHPWFVNGNRGELIEYHKIRCDQHLDDLKNEEEFNPILQMEAAYHLCACYLTIYDDFAGSNEVSPIIILKNSLDRLGVKSNERLQMRRCMLMQLKDDLRDQEIPMNQFREAVNIVYTNIVEKKTVSSPETYNALIYLREVLEKIKAITPEEWVKTDDSVDDVKRVFKNALGFIVKKPVRMFEGNAFFVDTYWDDHQRERYNLGNNMFVCMLEDEEKTTKAISSYLSEERRIHVRELVLFKKGLGSFSQEERSRIRGIIKDSKVNVRCIFIQEDNFNMIHKNGWRKELYRIVCISKKSIY